MEEYERKNNGGEHQITPRSRSKASPHLEERLIGRNVDLDLLFYFPQRYVDLFGEINKYQVFEMQQW